MQRHCTNSTIVGTDLCRRVRANVFSSGPAGIAITNLWRGFSRKCTYSINHIISQDPGGGAAHKGGGGA